MVDKLAHHYQPLMQMAVMQNAGGAEYILDHALNPCETQARLDGLKHKF